MPAEYDPMRPVYPVGSSAWSLLDLLGRFADPRYHSEGVTRLSDLHLKVGEVVRYRYDNELIPLPDGSRLTEPMAQHLVCALLSEEKRAQLLGHRIVDVDAGYEWGEKDLSFRVNAFHDREGLAATVRVLPRHVPSVGQVGFPTDGLWQELVELTQGLVIVTGITGSGKSTTIASLIQHINQHRRVRIITLEDPIEYRLESEQALISQRELGRHIPSFHEGLRSALREDPDIIFVGEMRDQETTSLALTAAETGHLVFSTLHTKDAKGVISRIVDMFPPERVKELSTQISFSLTCVIGQKLVPRANGRGRRAAMEVLKIVPAVGNLIRTGNWHQIYSAMETGTKHGMNTLESHLASLVQTGEIRREDAIRSANDPAIVSRLGN